MRRYQLSVTTDATGAGTATTLYPLTGYVTEIRYGGTVLNRGGSATYTFTRPDDGGTILALPATNGPWQSDPRGNTSTTGGVVSGTAVAGGVPVDGYIRLVTAAAAFSVTDTVNIYVDDENR